MPAARVCRTTKPTGGTAPATAAFTLDVYGHVSQKMRQQSADRMERFIQALSG